MIEVAAALSAATSAFNAIKKGLRSAETSKEWPVT